MKKKIVLFSSLFLITALFIGVQSCKKDSTTTTTTFALSTLKAGSVDMNGATSPNNVAAEPTIVAAFSVGVNPATADSTTITLLRTYDTVYISLTITVSGSTITIVPKESLGNGAFYKLNFLAGIQSTDGQSLAALTRTFTTEGTFVPAGQIAYWNFDDNVNDQVGSFNPSANGIVDLTYADSYKAAAGKCGYFNGTSTIVEIPNGDQLTDTQDFTLSFWVKAESAGHVDADGNPKGHFVLGLGAFYGFEFEIDGAYATCKLGATYSLENGTTASQDLWYNGQPLILPPDPDSTYVGWTFSRDLTGSGGLATLLMDKWAQVVCVFNGSTKIATMYINGQKMKEQDYHLYDNAMVGANGMQWVGDGVEEVNELAFGFIKSRAGTLWNNTPWGDYDIPTSNHFGGWLDNVRIFHKALTQTEISLVYNSEKP